MNLKPSTHRVICARTTLSRTSPRRALMFACGVTLSLPFGLVLNGISSPTLGATPSAAAAPVAAAAIADPCADRPRCFNAGAFTAEVLSLTSSSMQNARHHSIKMTVRFRNISDQPLILGYHASSSAAVDNFGNQYVPARPGTHDVSAQGIGIVEGRKADPQFQLAPGQARNATFQVIRFNAAGSAIGTAFNYDVTIDQLSILSGGQAIRTVRGDSLSFPNLSANMPVAAVTAPEALPTGEAVANAAAEHVTQKVLELFKKKK